MSSKGFMCVNKECESKLNLDIENHLDNAEAPSSVFLRMHCAEGLGQLDKPNLNITIFVTFETNKLESKAMKKLMKRFSTIETNLVSVNSNLLKMKNFLEAMANFLKDTRVDEQTSNFKFNRNPKAFEPQKKHLILQAMEPFSKEKANMEKDGWKEILETENNFKPNTQEGTLRRRKRI